MRVIEFLGIEVIALLLFGWWLLAYLGHRKRTRPTVRAVFVGGPLDNQERKLKRLTPTYTERIDHDRWAVYKHDTHGVYEFVDYVEGSTI